MEKIEDLKRRCYSSYRRGLALGTITKPLCCGRCGNEVPSDHLHGHHWSYHRPLDVSWLCWKCHARVHANLNWFKRLVNHWREINECLDLADKCDVVGKTDIAKILREIDSKLAEATRRGVARPVFRKLDNIPNGPDARQTYQAMLAKERVIGHVIPYM